MSKTINLAEKYSDKVQERFYQDSLTQSSFSKDLDMEFVGVRTVKVYDPDVAPLNDYTRSGSNRYGTPKELTDNIYEFQMKQDKAFTYTIDKGNAKEQFNIKTAATTLKRQMRLVVTPFIDKYRFNLWATKAGLHTALSAAPTKSTIAGMIMDATCALDDKFVPQEGRTLYIRNDMYKHLKLCDEYVKLEGIGTKALVKGVVGEFDGMPVKKVPSSYLPADVYFMIVFKNAAISPMKLNDYKIHTDPPGISGDLVEGRVMFDAFVKPTKADGIYVACKTGTVAADPTIVIASNSATITSETTEAVILYTTDGSDPRFSDTAKTYSASSKPTLASGETIRAAATKTGMYWSGVAEGTN